MANTITPYVTSAEVRAVVQRLESCDFGPGEFHHTHHLTVALCYLLDSSEEDAIALMRTSLLRFLKHCGSPAAYHETITVFWIKRVRHLLDQADKSRPLAELANGVIAECRDVRLINIYFRAEQLASEEARSRWVEPDLKPLESFSSRN